MQHRRLSIPGASPVQYGLPLLGLILLGLILLSSAAPVLAKDPPRSMVKGCKENRAEVCFYLGLNLTSQDPAASRVAYAKACALGYRKGCSEIYKASRALMDGSDAERQEAIGHQEAACEMDYGRSCTALATAYSKGDGVEVDHNLALELWRKGCSHGSRIGCRRVGTAYEKGDQLPRDLQQALAFFQKSCAQGLEGACADTGRLLIDGVTPAGGGPLSATERAEKAIVVLNQACLEPNLDKTRGDACLLLGQLFSNGQGVPEDPVRAFEAFHRGCRDKNAGSCLEAARAAEAGRGREKDLNAARGFFATACDRRSEEGCEGLCRLACDLGQPYACERLKSRRWPYALSCSMTNLGS